jgi:hypothetical protein
MYQTVVVYRYNASTFTPSSISHSAVTLHAFSLNVAPLEALRDLSTLLSEQGIIVRKLSNIRYGGLMAVYQIVPYIVPYISDHANNLLNFYTLFTETFISILII